MFDPTLPQTNSEIKSAELRDQFNGLKDLIDALTGRCDIVDANIASLEASLATATAELTLLESLNASRGFPATLTATGFGRSDVNGVYTRIADYNGAPAWKILGSPGNVRIIWNNFYPNYWTVKVDGSYDLYKCLTYTGTYIATYGTGPGGTVS